VTLGLLVLVLALGTARAAPNNDLDKGRQAYKAQDWDSAFKTLNALLYPSIELARAEDVWEAYVLLGASAYQLGNRPRAVDEFEKALRIDIERTITTNTHRPEVVQLYEDTKEKFKDRIARETERLAAAERERRIKEYLDTIGVYETSSFAVTFLPFGLSQRQNKQYRKGYLFMAGQAVTLVPSVAIFVYLAGKYGLSSTQVPLQDGPRVRQLQQIEIGTGLAFIGLYAWGVADAIINFKSKRLIKGDDSLLPKDFLDGTQLPKAPPKKTSLRDRLRIGPMITPTGVGIGLGWEND
jgi:tetratricopeptide (TPR) repeat protein